MHGHNARSVISFSYANIIGIIAFCRYVYVIWRPNRLIIVSQLKLIQLQVKEIYRLLRFVTLNDSHDNTQSNMIQTHSQNVPSKPPAGYIKSVSNFPVSPQIR